MINIGTAPGKSATKIMMLGAGELGKEALVGAGELGLQD